MNSQLLMNNNNISKHVYTSDNKKFNKSVQTIISNTVVDIIKYGAAGFAIGSFLEYILPDEEIEEKDSFILILEILFQVSAVVFIFMYLVNTGGGRLGIISYIIMIIGCQPNLLKKIDLIKSRLLQKEKEKEKENLNNSLKVLKVEVDEDKSNSEMDKLDSFENTVEDNDTMSTPLCELPSF